MLQQGRGRTATGWIKGPTHMCPGGGQIWRALVPSGDLCEVLQAERRQATLGLTFVRSRLYFSDSHSRNSFIHSWNQAQLGCRCPAPLRDCETSISLIVTLAVIQFSPTGRLKSAKQGCRSASAAGADVNTFIIAPAITALHARPFKEVDSQSLAFYFYLIR